MKLSIERVVIKNEDSNEYNIRYIVYLFVLSKSKFLRRNKFNKQILSEDNVKPDLFKTPEEALNHIKNKFKDIDYEIVSIQDKNPDDYVLVGLTNIYGERSFDNLYRVNTLTEKRWSYSLPLISTLHKGKYVYSKTKLINFHIINKFCANKFLPGFSLQQIFIIILDFLSRSIISGTHGKNYNKIKEHVLEILKLLKEDEN